MGILRHGTAEKGRCPWGQDEPQATSGEEAYVYMILFHGLLLVVSALFRIILLQQIFTHLPSVWLSLLIYLLEFHVSPYNILFQCCLSFVILLYSVSVILFMFILSVCSSHHSTFFYTF